ncbi:MAG: hypothetical protein AAF571_15320 [Verrucomicrobiota bacterium]
MKTHILLFALVSLTFCSTAEEKRSRDYYPDTFFIQDGKVYISFATGIGNVRILSDTYQVTTLPDGTTKSTRLPHPVPKSSPDYFTLIYTLEEWKALQHSLKSLASRSNAVD